MNESSATSPEQPPDEENDDNRRRRRTILKLSALALAGVAGGGGLMMRETQPAMALTGAGTAVESATATADDGIVSDVTLRDETDDDDAGIDLAWQGFESAPADITVTLDAKVTGAEGGTETSFYELLSGTVSVASTSGTDSFDWSDVFGESSASLLNHNEIDIGMFEATTDGATVTRELEVRFTATAPNASATDTATNTLTVNNRTADAGIGGTVDTHIST